MSSGIQSLTSVQIGKETTRGTLVAATRKLVLNPSTWRRKQTFERFEKQLSGSLAARARAPKLVEQWSEFELAFPLDFEQILLPLLSGVKGGVTPTTPGAGDARLWTFAPSLTADPAPTTYTLEFTEKSPADSAEMEAGYGLTTGFSVKIGDTGVPEVSASMVARATQDSTETGAIAAPTLHEGPALATAFYLDDTWAGLGGTQISGQIYGIEIKFGPFIRLAKYLNNRSDLDPAQYEYGPRSLEIMADVVHDPASAKLVQTEEALKTAGTLRFARVQVNGPAFAAPDASLNYFFRTDAALYHADDSLEERGRDRDGNLITRLHLISAEDPTSSKDVSFAVQNILTAFP